MKAVIPVQTGEVWAVAQRIILSSDAIGSCGVVVAYDQSKRIGALAHIMLPGSSCRSHLGYNTKYARDAIDDMLYKMVRLGADASRLEACLVGGGNVLNENDGLCEKIIGSITGILEEKGIRIVGRAVGGNVRRGVRLDIEKGTVDFFEGDGQMRLLHVWEQDEQ